MRHNADVGSKVAVELAKLREAQGRENKPASSSHASRVRMEEETEASASHSHKRPVRIGYLFSVLWSRREQVI